MSENYNRLFNRFKKNKILSSINIIHTIKRQKEFLIPEYFFFQVIKKIIVKIIFYPFKLFFFTIRRVFSPKKKIKKYDIIVVSHLVDLKYLNSSKDFYYGNLIKRINKKKVLKIFLNHTKYNSLYLNKVIRNRNTLVIDTYLNIFTELKIFLKKIMGILYLINYLTRKEVKLKEFKVLLFSLLGSQTSFSLRVYYYFKKLIKNTNVKNLFFTFEGYGWERMCIIAAKESKVKCIGYQHTIITKNHISIFNNPKSYAPNIIFCSHKQSMQELKNRIKSSEIKFKFIGNYKNELKKIKKIKFKKLSNKILVIPEGIYSECYDLFAFSLQCAKKFKKLSFTWRLHPVIKLSRIFQKLKLKKNNLPKNIIISRKSINKDFFENVFILYKGSSAAALGLLNRNYPIYLNNDIESFNLDPLQKYLKRKNYIKNSSDLINYIENIKRQKKFNLNKTIIKLKRDFFGKTKDISNMVY